MTTYRFYGDGGRVAKPKTGVVKSEAGRWDGGGKSETEERGGNI